MPVKSLLKPEIKKWLDKSIESELYASNLYKYIANNLQRLGYFGCQSFFLKESLDELSHYQNIVDFVNDMGDMAAMPAIQKINDPINSIMDALEISYETELELMRQYQRFYEIAESAKDCITATFIIEYMQIQRKSVGEFGDLIARFEKNKSDVFEFDKYMKKLANA